MENNIIGNPDLTTDHKYWLNDYIKNKIIPWDIRPYDSLNNDIAIGDNIAFVETDYKDNFKAICQGTIVGFTKCFVKIKPNDPGLFYYSYNEYKDGKWQPKEYILKKYNRVIKL